MRVVPVVSVILASLACGGAPPASPPTPSPAPAPGLRDTSPGAPPVGSPEPALGVFSESQVGCDLGQRRGGEDRLVGTLPVPCDRVERVLASAAGQRLLVTTSSGHHLVDVPARRVLALATPEGTVAGRVAFAGAEVHVAAAEEAEPVVEGDSAHYVIRGRRIPAFRPTDETSPVEWEWPHHLLELRGDRLVEVELTADPARIDAWAPEGADLLPGTVVEGEDLVADLDGIVPEGRGGFFRVAPRLALHAEAGGDWNQASTPVYRSDGEAWRPVPGLDGMDRGLRFAAREGWLLAQPEGEGPRLVGAAAGVAWSGPDGTAFFWPWAEEVPTGAAPSHCGEGEAAYFSCGVGLTRTASVCGAAGKVWYRYGPIGAPELVFPSDGAPSAFTSEETIGGSSYAHAVRFANEGVRYTVREAMASDPDQRFSGLIVEAKGRPVALPCSTWTTTDWGALAQVVPPSP